MRSIAPTSSQSGGISLIPQSPLQASPMNVGNALAVPLFTDFQNASECIRSHGPDSCCIMDVTGKVADRANLPFHVLELVRSDLGIWAHEHNKASLPLGDLSSTTWIRRLQSVSIIRPVDAGNPWRRTGRTMSNSVLVRFYTTEEGNGAGFDVRVVKMCTSLLSLSLLMKIWVSCCRLLLRWTIALKLCWKPRLMMLGECGKSLMPTAILSVKLDRMADSASQWICLNLSSLKSRRTVASWSRSSLCAIIGLLLYQSVEQWEELSSLLTKEVWFSGRVLCESPRWVLVDTSTGLLSDNVITRLKEWRVAGLISQDISYKSWHVNKESRIKSQQWCKS